MISLFYVHIAQICALRFSLRSWWPGRISRWWRRRGEPSPVLARRLLRQSASRWRGTPLAKAHMLAWSAC